MKAFKTMLILVIMLSGQLSFGTGNETCCPDTSSVHLLASNNQLQLDEMQAESQIEIAKVPSLQTSVAQKLTKQQSMMNQVQAETERPIELLLPSLAKQVEVKLNGGMLIQDRETEEEAFIQPHF